MRTFFVYLWLELKRTMKRIPYVIGGAIVLALLSGTIAFSAVRILYGESRVGMISVGVVMPEEDALAGKLMQMIESLDSVESLCTFTYLEEEEGLAGLKDGTYFALLKIPDRMVESIMTGTNIPAVVVFPEHSGLPAAVFRELTEAGCSILGTSQAGIYAADEYLIDHGQAVFVPKAEEDLNRIFLSYALDRDVYFRKETVSVADDVGIGVHFASSAAVLALLLLGIPLAPVLRPDPVALRQKLSLAGVGRMGRILVRFCCVASVLVLLLGIPMILCVVRRYVDGSSVSVILFFLICLAASGWILMFYEAYRNTAAAILSLFSTTVVMMFLSGGIVPEVFLPDMVRAVGKWLPTMFFMEAFYGMVTGSGTVVAVKLLGTIAVCLGVSVMAGGKE